MSTKPVMFKKNKNLRHDHSISISVVVDSEDIDEVEAYADSLMKDILESVDVVAADWYNISPIRKYRSKKEPKDVSNT